MMDLSLRRRFFAEEIEAVARLRSAALVEALATVPRERFLPAGPWAIAAEADVPGLSPLKTCHTQDANPARVYHNISIAIDPSRQLFNGQPGTLAPWIDALEVAAGARVMHVGCGLGYYTALIASCVGPGGRVLAFEADADLAAGACANLADMPWVEVRADERALPGDQSFDAIVINAGITHPLDAWLDALAPGGRIVLPMTAAIPGTGTIGKGIVFLATRGAEDQFALRRLGFVAIYSAVAIRDDALNAALGKAMMANLQGAQAVTRLRRDPHGASASCWLHGSSFCLSA